MFIVIEGTDGSGKSLQTGLLKSKLERKGFRIKENSELTSLKTGQISLLENMFFDKGYGVKLDDYPRYKTSVWGKLIGRMLMSEFGNPMEISPYLTCLPYMIDEYFGSKDINRWLNQGYCVLSNRYFTSNVHQIAKLKGKERKIYRNWLWQTGWQDMGILKPDIVIVLAVLPEISAKLILQKQNRSYTNGKKKDAAEECLQHQKDTYDEYNRTCKDNSNWHWIDCCQKGYLLKPEQIQLKIIKILKDKNII